MSEEKSSYRQIFKATSIFGGVQAFNVLISIIRSKIIAVVLGPTGMGISGLFISAMGLLSAVSSFGLGVSSIKDISQANANNDKQSLFHSASILNKIVWFTGLFGSILTLILSPLLSKITFNSYNYTWSFIFLSLTVFFGQLTVGKNAVLQGTRSLKWLASANLTSSVVSLLLTVPLYFFFGVKGIVPAMIIVSVSTLIITQIYYKKLNLVLPSIPNKTALKDGKSMLKIGFFLSLSGLIASGCTYAVRIFITKFGGVVHVGFYNAGFGIINSYVGIIFTAMATDYYPRLAAVAKEKTKFISVINQQGNVSLYILGPIITAFIIFINVVIVILFSEQFLPISTMMQYAILGVFFKAASWLLGFLVLAKGATKLFFWSELSANFYITVLTCLGYYFFGLKGLGFSFIISYFLYLIQMLFITKKKYGFYFENSFIKVFAVQGSVAIIAFIIKEVFEETLYSYVIGIVLILCSALYSLYNINKIIDIKDILLKFKNDRDKK